jgi:hypothetical protein
MQAETLRENTAHWRLLDRPVEPDDDRKGAWEQKSELNGQRFWFLHRRSPLHRATRGPPPPLRGGGWSNRKFAHPGGGEEAYDAAI